VQLETSAVACEYTLSLDVIVMDADPSNFTAITGDASGLIYTVELLLPHFPRKLHRTTSMVYVLSTNSREGGTGDAGINEYVPPFRKSSILATLKVRLFFTMNWCDAHGRPANPVELDTSTTKFLHST
jgi:hypothetical protein